MILLDFEDLDFNFLLEKHNILEKQFVCACNSVSGHMFREQDFLRILGDDFSSIKIDSEIFDSILPRQNIMFREETVITVFSNLDAPKKIRRKSYEDFKKFQRVCEILNCNIFIRSVVGEFLQRKYHFEDFPFFLKKEHKYFKIDFINKLAFSTLFYQIGEWNFQGKFAEFSFRNFKKRSIDEYQQMYFKMDSNFDYCCYLLLNCVNGTTYSYDPWKYYKKELQKVELTEEQEYAVNLFFLSQLYLLKKNILKIEDNDEKYNIKEVHTTSTSKPETEKKTKRFVSTDNPRFRPDERAIFNHWNSKNLRKHKDGNTKGINEFITFYRNPQKYVGKDEISVETVIGTIDQFELMVNDPEVQPLNERSKKYLRGFGLNDFFFHPRSGRSIISEILDKGIQTRVKPHSTEMFDKVCLVIQRGIKGVGLSTKNKNIVGTFTRKMVQWLEDQGTRLVPGNSYTMIAVEVMKELFEKRKFGFLFIVSEEFFLNFFPKFCFERGFVKKHTEKKVLEYKNPNANKSDSSPVQNRDDDSSSSLKRMLELRKQNASKRGEFSKD